MEYPGLIVSGWAALAGYIVGMLYYDRRNRPKTRAEISVPDVNTCNQVTATTDLKADVEIEADVDTPSFLGEPEPVKLRIKSAKRKKRRR